MNATTKQLYENALHLPGPERAELAAWLIESLDAGGEDDVAAAWDAEIRRRIDELDGGQVAAIPWPEARRIILGVANYRSRET